MKRHSFSIKRCLLFYIKRKYYLKFLKTKNFKVPTSFHHNKQHGFLRSVGNVICTKIMTDHRWHHWLCKERHLLLKYIASKWWCWRTPYLPSIEVVDTVCGPYITLWPSVVGLVQLDLLTLKGGSFWGGDQGCWTRPDPMHGAAGTF